MIYIWQRYLFTRLVKSFLFLLVSIFVLFVFIDLSTRSGKILGKNHFLGYETLLYYFYQFSNYSHFFFPLAFILASIRVLFDLNVHNELLALQMGGLSKKRLLLPFFLLAALLSLLLLANQEWVTPKTLSSAHEYTKTYARHKKRALREHLQTISLEDGSEIIFQSINEMTKELFDVFWLQNDSTFWYMKYFQINPSVGRWVDRFQYIDTQWKKTDRFETLEFPQIVIDEKKALEPFTPYERRSVSNLILQAYKSPIERPKLLSHLFYKFTSSVFILFIIFLIGPLCFRFSRTQSAFIILALSLFGFLAVMMLLDGLLVLGENQVIPATIAFGLPLGLLLGICYRSFGKL